MWRAVSRDLVDPDHAALVSYGLRWGFGCGVDISKLRGRRRFRNYPSALDARGAVSEATQKRVAAGKTIDMGLWSAGTQEALGRLFESYAIFPMGAVGKPLEPGVMRPTSDHTRTGLNSATIMGMLSHSLDTYNRVAWLLQQGYFMAVTDVDAAFPMLPLAIWLWPFMLFRFYPSTTGSQENLYLHVCGDFGTRGLPGVFKIFFVDVLVNMARSAMVLTLPMEVYVDDAAIVGAIAGHVDEAMGDFQDWCVDVSGVKFKVIKDKLAAQVQLYLGFWWDSIHLTRTLEEAKLAQYLEQLLEFAGAASLTLRQRQSIIGRMQRAILTLPPGAACLLASMLALIAGLTYPWHRRRTSKQERSDYLFLHRLLKMNMGRGYYSFAGFSWTSPTFSDASREHRFAGGGWVSFDWNSATSGMRSELCHIFYDAYIYGSAARKKCIATLEADSMDRAIQANMARWRMRLVPFGLDNASYWGAAVKGRSGAPALNFYCRRLFEYQIKGEFVLVPFWLSTHLNKFADDLSRDAVDEFRQRLRQSSVLPPHFTMPPVELHVLHPHPRLRRTVALPERQDEGRLRRTSVTPGHHNPNMCPGGDHASHVRTAAEQGLCEARPSLVCDGLGLFAAAPFAEGEPLVRMLQSSLVPVAEAALRAQQLGLPDDDSYFQRTHAKGATAFVDLSWTSPSDRPLWYLLNHAHASIANVTPAIEQPAGGEPCLVWRAARDIGVDEELRFAYNGDVPPEWDADRSYSGGTDVDLAHLVFGKRRRQPVRRDDVRRRRTSVSPGHHNPNMCPGGDHASHVRSAAQAGAMLPLRSLYRGVPAEYLGLLDKLMDNRLRPSSMRTVQRGRDLWIETADEHGWSHVIDSDDPASTGKMATFVMRVAFQTDLAYVSIANYVWGARTWMKLQHQYDPVLGCPVWSDFLDSIKVLTFSVAEPRAELQFDDLVRILASLDPDVFEDAQDGLLYTLYAATFSRTEVLPSAMTGPNGFDPAFHWQVRDLRTLVLALGTLIGVRFKGTKTDPRQARLSAQTAFAAMAGAPSEGAPRGDWRYVGDVPKFTSTDHGLVDSPIFSAFHWLRALLQFYPDGRSPTDPLFMHVDGVRPLSSASARARLHLRQRSLGLSDASALHGIRVCWYTRSKIANGKEFTVAHGGWESEAHERYEAFQIGQVANCFARAVGVHDVYEASRPRDINQGPVRRHPDALFPSRAPAGPAAPPEPPSAPEVPGIFTAEADGVALSFSDEELHAAWSGLVELPPGFTLRVARGLTAFPVYLHEDGTCCHRIAEAWAYHDPSTDDEDEDVIADLTQAARVRIGGELAAQARLVASDAGIADPDGDPDLMRELVEQVAAVRAAQARPPGALGSMAVVASVEVESDVSRPPSPRRLRSRPTSRNQ